MDARAELVVGRDDRGRTVPVRRRGEAPLLLRVTESGPRGLTVHLVGGAAGPLGGDRLVTTVDAGERTTLRVRSVAASLLQPGPSGGASAADVAVTVGSGATLDWCPQPLVSVVGSEHVQRTTVAIADTSATVRWVDEVVLGRHAESGGRLTLHQRFTVAGRPIVQHTVTFDPATAGVGRHGRSRVMVSVVAGGPGFANTSADRIAGRDPTSAALVRPSVRIARLRLDDSYTMLVALGDDLDVVRSGLDDDAFGPVSQWELVS